MNVENFGTSIIHATHKERNPYGALSTPIFQTSTFCFNNVEEGMDIFSGKLPGYNYTRGGNPTTNALEKKIAVLENGEDCIVTSSGMGAIGGVLVDLLKSGDHIVCGSCVYGCTDFVMNNTLKKFGVEVSFVDTTNLNEVEKSIKENTKLIYFESLTNPTMVLSDIKEIVNIAHKKNVLVVVDNTFTPPPEIRPLDLGVDLVVHSCTKYINGHGDVLAGAIIGSKKLLDSIRSFSVSKLCGATPSPFDAFLVIRGMQTMELRMKRHCENGQTIANYLESNEYVKKVYYPGLKSNSQYKLANKLMNGNFGGILSFELNDNVKNMDGFEACKKVLNDLKIISIAVSLGDPATLIQHPASMTHGAMTKEERKRANINDCLIRVSCGLENSEDLINDFKQAFDSI